MLSTQSQHYVMKIQTADGSVLDAFNTVGNLLTQGGMGYVVGLQSYFGAAFLKRCLYCEFSIETGEITIEIFGLYSTEKLLPLLLQKALFEAVWTSWSRHLPADSKFIKQSICYCQKHVEGGLSWERITPQRKKKDNKLKL